MADRYIRGFYCVDVFCGIVVHSLKIPMNAEDKRTIRGDMQEILRKFLKGLVIGTTYTIDVPFYMNIARLHVLRRRLGKKARPDAVVSVGRMIGLLKRIDEHMFMYNERVPDGTPPAPPPGA